MSVDVGMDRSGVWLSQPCAEDNSEEFLRVDWDAVPLLIAALQEALSAYHSKASS